jgi:hypothetical protein
MLSFLFLRDFFLRTLLLHIYTFFEAQEEPEEGRASEKYSDPAPRHPTTKIKELIGFQKAFSL